MWGVGKMIEFIDETADKLGTEFNRSNMMAIQGFIGINTVFNSDGSITETNENGETLVTKFNDDGSISETFTGEKTITKKTTFNELGTITEVLS